jgi:hypothetical protein
MNLRVSAAVGIAALAGALLWILVPPFPAPTMLLDVSLTDIADRLGPPIDMSQEGPQELRSAKSVGWVKSRGIATWTLRADWSNSGADRYSHPDMVFRCLRLRWLPETVSVLLMLPCEAVTRGRIMASNLRWSGP